MPYHIRVLGTQNPDIHIDDLLAGLEADGLVAELALVEDETPETWTFIEVANAEGEVLAQIERNPIVEGETGQQELMEFLEEIPYEQPASAAQWLINFFAKVKVTYAFQMLSAAFDDDNYSILNSLRSAIWNKTGGILQADNEGFTNEDGYQILWQFADDVSGPWSCAVLNEAGGWDNFEMELSDETQRAEFKEGIVPAAAKRL